MSKIIGIYCIRNTITNQLYIGQSIDIHRRKRTHLNNLRNNCHVNNYLQNSFNYYGEDAFEFKILCECSKEELDNEEIKLMNLYASQQFGFNVCDGGTHVFPNNINENHGMWRKDISNERIKELYLQDYSSEQIARIFECSRRTINRRLVKIFGQEEYDKLKKKKQVERAKKYAKPNPNYKTEEILEYAKQGYNSVEIANIIGCSDSTVMGRLRKVLTDQEYADYKKQNTNRKMHDMRKTAYTKEAVQKRVKKVKKYTLWDGSNVHYQKSYNLFYARYNANDIRIMGFKDFISPQIVVDLINEYK